MKLWGLGLALLVIVCTDIPLISCHYWTKGSVSGPRVLPTNGEPWPKPQKVKVYGRGESFMILRPSVFQFSIGNKTCAIVDAALKRYYSIILNLHTGLQRVYGKSEQKLWKDVQGYKGYLDELVVDLRNPCEFLPHEDMDESYSLLVNSPESPFKAVLSANTNWGILRGLETFSQLLFSWSHTSAIAIKSQSIDDFPRFSFRSVLLDSARHFLKKEVILENLDLMAMNKMNVFHWHIVDDQSFPFQSRTFPALSEKGSYHPYTHVYTPEDIQEIIEYARFRGIRVIPEFDSPGHTQSWGLGHPNLLTKCYKNGTDGRPHPDGTFGPIDPTKLETYEFLYDFFSEVVQVFPEKYLFLGGDEVDFSCWESNPKIGAFMAAKNLTSYAELEGFYMQNLIRLVESYPQNKTYIVWQEVFDNGVQLQGNALVNVWKGGDFKEEMANVTQRGFKTILYACWYLDMITWGIDWPKYYQCDPQSFNGTKEEVELVIGGGAALWGEFVDSTNVIQRLWPRASAPAERLWSNARVNDTHEAAGRLEEHRCRLLSRGFSVQPANGPGFCIFN